MLGLEKVRPVVRIGKYFIKLFSSKSQAIKGEIQPKNPMYPVSLRIKREIKFPFYPN